MSAAPCAGRTRPVRATESPDEIPAASVRDARDLVLSCAGSLDAADVALADALDRVLARDVIARSDSPPADTSAVDGFALAEEACPALGARFRLCGEAAAGRPFTGALPHGAAVQIFTGAEIPGGARRVLPAECVSLVDAVATVTARDDEAHIRRRAENHRAGAVVLRAGTKLGPLELALAASAGHDQVAVHRAVRVAHLITGSELVAAGEAAGPGQIPDANGPLISALVRRAGAELVGQKLLGDDLAACRTALEAMPPHDVLLVSGGSGFGGYDFARPLLTALGFAIRFRSVRMRPGKPLAFATRGSQLAFALPGNPVSHWATWELLVGPALRRLAGEAVSSALPVRRGQLGTAWSGNDADREIFWPARAELRGESWQVHPCRFLSSGDLAGVAGANALLCAPRGGHAPAGAAVDFILCP